MTEQVHERMAKDYYKTLGVDKNASRDEIKSAYKRLAKKHHPDLNKDDSSAAEKFKEINEAAAVLGDEEKRQQYDSMGHDAFEHAGRGGGFNQDFSGFDFSGFQQGGFDFDSIFDMFTGGFSGGRRTRRGDDLRYDVTLTLEEAAEGVAQRISLRKLVVCTSCAGAGGKGQKQCASCHGHGVVRQARRTPFGVFQTQTTCKTCEGSGESFDTLCDTCDGQGRVSKTVQLDVDIPAGVDNGTRVRVSGEGDAGPRGSRAGDLYLFITVKPHPVFQREGNDIVLDAPVSFSTAVFGGEITVPTLSGDANVKIPRGTQSHTMFRLRGKGMPNVHGHGHGDAYVRVMLETPEKLTKKQEQALKEYADLVDNEPHMGLFKKLKEKLK